ncbi:MAG TPA: protein kinase, partial [Polyangiaceae bacterium]|nr:protein kinase [Polyangiaceae bacterium]
MLNADDRPPETVGNFRVIRRLASGGTSDVLLARPIKPAGDHRPVVLKMLLPPYRDDPSFERMLAREAEAYGRLHHPFIVQLFEVFAVRDKLVIVLEYVDGLALNRLRAQLQGAGGWLEDRASAYLAWCLFSALSAAHTARDPETGQLAPVIHRDINPSNVLVPWDGRVKLADFSIAKVAGVSGDTKTGISKGTFGYMAPEQVRGEKITERTDIYTASLILWEQFARRKAIQYSALPEIEVMRAMAYPHLVSLDVLRPDLPDKIRRAVSMGLEADPARRELSADDMIEILHDFVAPDEGRRLLQDTLYRLREGEEDPAIGDRSWARMTPIAAPDASSYNGALARDENLPAFPLEGMPESAAAPPRAAARIVKPSAQMHASQESQDETRPRPGGDPSEASEIETLSRPSTVSFSELLLPRSADPVGPRSDPGEPRSPSSVPPDDHQVTLQGGLEVVSNLLPAPALPPEKREGPPSSPAILEETLVSPAPAGIPTPTSKSVPVSILSNTSPGRSSPDISATYPDEMLPDLSNTMTDPDVPPVAPVRSNSELAATVPAIPSQMLGPGAAPAVPPATPGLKYPEGGIFASPPQGAAPLAQAGAALGAGQTKTGKS